MRRILVNKPENQWQLQILFPAMRLALNGVPAYGRVVYTTFQFALPGGVELLLEQSLTGFNLDSHLGLLGFLRECEYMSPAKITKFELAGRERQIDSKGNVVVQEGPFHSSPDVLNMYFFVSMLRLSNRVFLQEEIESDYILDVLESPLHTRLAEADKVGPLVFLEKILRLLDSFYSRDMAFKGRRHGRVSGFERMQRLMSVFDQAGFKGFKLSGDGAEDAYSFLCLFGP
jgi:hypothetical protein